LTHFSLKSGGLDFATGIGSEEEFSESGLFPLNGHLEHTSFPVDPVPRENDEKPGAPLTICG
jgi:hypothetical protein